RKVEMPPGKGAGAKLAAGEASPGSRGGGMRGVVSAAECGDRTIDQASRLDPIAFREREVGTQRREQRGNQFRVLHDCRRRAAKTIEDGKQLVVGELGCRGDIRASRRAAAAGNEQMHGGPS